MPWKKLILLGDSITQYGYSPEGKWVSMLSDRLQRKCDVINRGFAGYVSRDLLRLLPEIFEEFEVKDIAGVIIMLGSNDSARVIKVDIGCFGCRIKDLNKESFAF